MQSFAPRDAFILKIQRELLSPEIRPKSFGTFEKQASHTHILASLLVFLQAHNFNAKKKEIYYSYILNI